MAKAKVAVYIRIEQEVYDELEKQANKCIPSMSVSALVIKLLANYTATKKEV
jgi:hypothetical protein